MHAIEKSGTHLSALNPKAVKKFYFNNSDIIMYAVSISNSENKAIVYKYDDIYQVCMAKYYAIGDKKPFELRTTDDQLFYSLQLDGENRIGNFKISRNSRLNDFSHDVYALRMQKRSLKSGSRDNATEEDCCRHASTWNACMNCTVADCGKSWICVAGLVVAGYETLAGFAVSCIGVGPDASC